MAGQYQKLGNKQYNSPIQLYSDRSIKEILEKETRVLDNGTIGIDFNNPMINKPANLQNSAVLRMLEEEENRRRSGQQASLKRVAWPPPIDSELEGYVEQEPVQSQGGPLYSKTYDSQNTQAPVQQPVTSPVLQQQQPKSPIATNNTSQPIFSPSTPSSQTAAQSPYQSTPVSPSINKSPVGFTSLAKPWSPQNQSAPQFKTVQLSSANTQSYQSSQSYAYQHQSQEQIRETQTQRQETNFQQYQATPFIEKQHTVVKNKEQQTIIPTSFSNLKQSNILQEEPSKLSQQPPKPASSEKSVTVPIQSQSPAAAQGVGQNQIPVQRYQPPAKQVEPPPSTITLRPQAPVSQAAPPLVTSQPATATLRGGKHLRGDLKWPPEDVRERMAAEEQHLVDLSKGPAIKPRKNCKDYSNFFAKHALNSGYPGYKIPPGTQFYDHNPVM